MTKHRKTTSLLYYNFVLSLISVILFSIQYVSRVSLLYFIIKCDVKNYFIKN